ncbi:hypothetical protein M3Y96_01238300 [Aphelenchoides besseyi]|nr:hypothetical protein M3Y96_01238300 [Aphelenchoides besseyi]
MKYSHSIPLFGILISGAFGYPFRPESDEYRSHEFSAQLYDDENEEFSKHSFGQPLYGEWPSYDQNQWASHEQTFPFMPPNPFDEMPYEHMNVFDDHFPFDQYNVNVPSHDNAPMPPQDPVDGTFGGYGAQVAEQDVLPYPLRQWDNPQQRSLEPMEMGQKFSGRGRETESMFHNPPSI